MNVKAAALAVCSFTVLTAVGFAAGSDASLDRARALQLAGKLAEARVIYDELLGSPALSPQRESAVRLELSRIHLAEGRYPDAVTESRRSVALARVQSDRSLEGNALTVTGLARMYSGEYAAARDDFLAALQAAEDVRDASAQVTRLNDLGNVFYYQGRYADAMQRYRQALTIVEAHGGDSWNPSRRQLTVANIATIYQRLGQYRNALDTYAGMRALPSALPVAEQAQLLANMGALYRRLGDPVKALETYHAAQSLLREGRLQNGEITVLNNIGIAQALDLHELSAALVTFDQALAMARSSGSKPLELQSLLYRGETLFRLNRYAGAEQDFVSASSLADAVHAPEDKWKALYGLARVARLRGDAGESRKLLQESVAVIESIRSKAGSATPRGSFLADKRQVYDLLIDVQIREPHPDVRELFRLMEQSRARSLKDLKSVPAKADLDAVRQSVPPRTLVVEYWIGDEAMAAVWITAQGSGQYSHTGVASLRRDLAALSTALSNPGNGNWRDASTRVAGTLLDGLKPLLESGDFSRLVVVPDRELARVPFEVLPPAAGNPARVLDRVSVAYLPTASFLRAPVAHRSVVPFWNRMLLAFADPSPGTSEVGTDMPSPGATGRLPGAAAEVRDISALLDGRNSEHVGADARKLYLEQQHDPAYPVLHLATHASIDPEDANRSYILFAPAHPSQQYDYLFLKEVSTLDLRHVDLVTASACETQNGAFVEGEGLENFSQAFLSAGARSVVTSLWKVSDRATASLMRTFYGELAAGREAGDALREAKLQYLRSARSGEQEPFYWAAFILSGDITLRLPLVISWTTTLAGCLVFAGIVLLLVHRLRN